MKTTRIGVSWILLLAATSPVAFGQTSASIERRPAPVLAPGDLFADARVLDVAELEARLVGGEERVPVIVKLLRPAAMEAFDDWRVPARAAQHRADVAKMLDLALRRLPAAEFTLLRRLENAPIFSARITPAGLALLLAGGDVETVELNGVVRAHTDEGITLMQADDVRSIYSGSGRSIAIVDSGVDYTHAALGGGSFPNAKVIGGHDFGDDDQDPMDQNGHGTSVAGVAAGDIVTSGSYVGGVAPGARIYALKVVAGGAITASDADIQAAWDWCVTHQDDDPSNPIQVINTSMGRDGFTSACGGAYETTAANCVSAGIALFCASGNDGYSDGVAAPACANSVISVGAVYDANVGSKTFLPCVDVTTAADQVTCYSNSASILEVVAPSENARVPAFGGGYAGFGGTSAASPYAAGAALVLLHAAEASGASVSPQTLRDILIASGDPVMDPKAGLTFPRVNVARAVPLLADVWVDFSYAGIETGSIHQPFNTLAEGVAAAPVRGVVSVRAGTTTEKPTISKPITIKAAGGNVTIGD